MSRPLYTIARDIRRDWKKVNYAAEPYLAAMAQLDHITDSYGYDDARGIVNYFLSNARGWRGPVAKAIKQELKDLLSGAEIRQALADLNRWRQKALAGRTRAMPGVGLTNLDALSRADCGRLRDQYMEAAPGSPEQLYARYAALRYDAMGYRLKGEIAKALADEQLMDLIYHELPAAYQW